MTTTNNLRPGQLLWARQKINGDLIVAYVLRSERILGATGLWIQRIDPEGWGDSAPLADFVEAFDLLGPVLVPDERPAPDYLPKPNQVNVVEPWS